MAITLTALNAAFGAYYIAGGANMQRLLKRLAQPSVSEMAFTPIATDDTVWRGAVAQMGSSLQAWQKAFTSAGNLTFTPSEIRTYLMKYDTEVVPAELEDSYVGFLAANGLSYKDWPFVRWFIEEHLVPKVLEDFEMNAFYKGVYVAPTAGTAGTPSASMNGLEKVIKDAITAGTITAAVTGAFTPTAGATTPQLKAKEYVDYVRAFIDTNIPEQYRDLSDMQLLMSAKNARMYMEGCDLMYNTNYAKEPDLAKVYNTNIRVVGLPSMATKNRLIVSPKSNSYILKNRGPLAPKVQEQGYALWVLGTLRRGVGFGVHAMVWTNDVD